MAQFQNMNQVTQGPIKGRVSEVPNPSTVTCQVTPKSGNTLNPGTAVKLIAGTSPQILVEKAAATEQIFGFVVWTPKKVAWTAGQPLEIVLQGSIMEMETNGAINRGQLCEIVASGDKIAGWAGVNTTIGTALDTATAANQLIRVLIDTDLEYSSSSSSSSSKSSSSSSSSSAT